MESEGCCHLSHLLHWSCLVSRQGYMCTDTKYRGSHDSRALGYGSVCQCSVIWTQLADRVAVIFASQLMSYAASIVVTLYHSAQLRSSGARTVSKLTATLSKGSLLYALSLLGRSLDLHSSISIPFDHASSNLCCKHHFFFLTGMYFDVFPCANTHYDW